MYIAYKNNNFLPLVNLSPLLLLAWMAWYFDFLYWGYYIGYFFIAKLFISFISFFRSEKEKNIFIYSFYFLFFLTVLLISHHNYYYQVPFDAYGDDLRFYEWGIKLKENVFVGSYSAYEKIIAVIFKIYSFFGFNNNLHQVLPFNLVFGSLVVVLSYRLALRVAGVDLPYYVMFLSVLCNYTFSQNVVHLYRDVYIAFFSIMFLLDICEGRRTRAVVWIFCVLPFRLPSGLILIFLFLIGFIAKLTFSNLFKFFSLSIFFAFALIFSVGLGLTVSKYNFSDVDSIVTERVAKFSASSEAAGGGMAVVNSSPFFVRLFISNYVQVVRPIKINGIYHPIRESLEQRLILNHRSIGWAITTITLVFLIGPYVSGVTNALVFRKNIDPNFILYFLVTVFVISFLSFLDRHRISLIPLFPTLYAIGISFSSVTSFRFNKKQFFFFSSLIFLFIVLWGAF